MAKNDDLKLLGAWFSPFALRVQIALNLKDVDYENIEESLNPKSELLLQSNPVHKKIPVLFHAGKPICESSIIVEYIDEVWTNAPSILPTKAYDRAIARFWVAYVDDKVLGALRSILMSEDEEEKKAHFGQMDEVVERMEELLKKNSEGKAYFGGDTIGCIDIAFGSFLRWINVIEKMNGKIMLDEAKNPVLAKWAETFHVDPAVKGLVPETDKLIGYANSLKEKMAAMKLQNK